MTEVWERNRRAESCGSQHGGPVGDGCRIYTIGTKFYPRICIQLASANHGVSTAIMVSRLDFKGDLGKWCHLPNQLIPALVEMLLERAK